MTLVKDGWEEEARRYAGNADYWRERAEKAEAELKAIRPAEMPDEPTVIVRLGESFIRLRDYDALRTFALRMKAEAEHWKDYAQHQEQCSECAESVGYCETGSALRDAAIDKERKA